MKISIQSSVLKLLFTLKLVLILPFVNLPSFFRITQQVSEAANPMDAEPLSGAWIFLPRGLHPHQSQWLSLRNPGPESQVVP